MSVNRAVSECLVKIATARDTAQAVLQLGYCYTYNILIVKGDEIQHEKYSVTTTIPGLTINLVKK